MKHRQQTTASDVKNKDIGDIHAQKKSIIQQTIKGKYTHISFSETLSKNYEGKQKTGEYKESDTYISVNVNLKKHLPFSENTIKANKIVCKILKSRYKLTYLYTPSNVELKKYYSALKNSEFVAE